MPRTDPAIKAAIYEEYVKGPDRPTAANLAGKYGVTKRTIESWSRKDGWVKERAAYLRSIAVETEKAVAVKVAQSKGTKSDDRAKAIDKARWWEQALRNLGVGLLQGLVVTEDMSRAEAEALMLEWAQLPKEQRAKLFPAVARASVEVTKSIELLQGHPTDRMEILSSPAWIELQQALIVVLQAHPEALEDTRRVLEEYAGRGGGE